MRVVGGRSYQRGQTQRIVHCSSFVDVLLQCNYYCKVHTLTTCSFVRIVLFTCGYFFKAYPYHAIHHVHTMQATSTFACLCNGPIPRRICNSGFYWLIECLVSLLNPVILLAPSLSHNTRQEGKKWKKGTDHPVTV